MTALVFPRCPLLGVCVCFILGIVLNQSFKVPFAVLFLFTVLFLSLSLLIRKATLATIFILVAIIFLGGLYSGNYQLVPSRHVSRMPYRDRAGLVMVEGVVISDAELRGFFGRKKTVFILELKRIRSEGGWKETEGRILVNLFRDEDVRYGDALLLEGALHRPFNFSKNGIFSYREYLRRQGILFILSVKKTGRVEKLTPRRGRVMTGGILGLKHALKGILRKHLPDDEAGIMQAFLLGDRSGIPKNVYGLFKVSGVAHIIAISGFNIGIVASGILFFLKMFPIPRRGQYLLTIALLISYAFLTGGQPSVVRATIMAVVFLLGFLVEREPEPMNSLALAALIILLMNPLNVFDAGFQLSFLSVIAIYLFYSGTLDILCKLFHRIEPWLGNGKKPGGAGKLCGVRCWVLYHLRQSLALSLAVYAVVGPLIAYYFRLITPIVVFANIVVVPLASFLIFLGMGLLLVGVLFPFGAAAFANCITVLLNLMVVSVGFCARIPGAYIELKRAPLWAVIVYYALVASVFLTTRLLKKKEGLSL
ncbi:MAG TPA: ComEC/Rec2 family competence protein [Candidatus Omnitrophota bacterium]|nr:ComEC/Rec2 family competence protein [Candidatus Omnitrophota bacterium]